MGWRTECSGTTYVGIVADDLGTIRFVFCMVCRTKAVDATNRRRGSGTARR